MAAEWRNPCAVISPTPRALQAARSRKLNALLENGAPEYDRPYDSCSFTVRTSTSLYLPYPSAIR